jgi:hypothetical protein
VPNLTLCDGQMKPTPPETRTDPQDETYNPWSVVNLVFHHLAAQGLHPVLGEAGDPGPPAAQLLSALGIRPAAEGDRQIAQRVRSDLADLRAAVFGEDPSAGE